MEPAYFLSLAAGNSTSLTPTCSYNIRLQQNIEDIARDGGTTSPTVIGSAKLTTRRHLSFLSFSKTVTACRNGMFPTLGDAILIQVTGLGIRASVEVAASKAMSVAKSPPRL